MRAIVAALVCIFLSGTPATGGEPLIRSTPAEIEAQAVHNAGAGTSGVSGIRTTVLAGDPTKPGLYTIRLSVPAHTQIAAHTHRDARQATVTSGTWYFGFGRVASGSMKKALPPGSFYNEPAGVAHFAETKDEPVVVHITGYGPTDTVYIDPAHDPRPDQTSQPPSVPIAP